MARASKTLLKGCLTVINLLFFMTGGGILLCGFLLKSADTVSHFVDDVSLKAFQESLHLFSYILIVTGSMTFLIAAFGCCGALMENKCLLRGYTFILALLVVAEIIGSVITYLQWSMIEQGFKNSALQYVQSKYKEKGTMADKSWNSLMRELQCCGINGFKDFEKNKHFREPPHVVPSVCCKETPGKQGSSASNELYDDCYAEALEGNQTNPQYFNPNGCFSKVLEKFEPYTIPACVTAGLIVGFEIFLLVCSMILSRNISTNNRE